MGVKYVIVEPDPPRPRWKTAAVVIAALLAAAWLQGRENGSADSPRPRPASSPSASAGPRATP
ncbi:hypothetical protein [Streptomyces sp. NPDC050392]|uniref:hypothetical protein n=1 Tax=Streptomyces sp. NPDC050392 TaxID=3155782 RepID=UPI003435A4A0